MIYIVEEDDKDFVILQGGDDEEEHYLHFSTRVTPVMPAFWNDNVVHICVSEDYPGKGSPCPS